MSNLPQQTADKNAPPSLAVQLASMDPDERLEFMASLDDETAALLLYDWRAWARPEQLPPDWNWRVWLLLTGRGWGKTRVGAEWCRDQIENKGKSRLAMVGRTAADVRDVMVEGESGILAVSPPWNKPKYEVSKRRLTWPNGAIATLFSADEPDLLRGPQHDGAWGDEVAAWRYPETWDMLMFGLRLGLNPQAVVTTTPRPTKIIRRLAADPTTHVTVGSLYENAANLAPTFIQDILKTYEGTRLGLQEIHGKVLDDVVGALWTPSMLEDLRLRRLPAGVTLKRIGVGVDPEASDFETAAETGIVIAGLGTDDQGYVLDDMTIKGTPATWGLQVVRAYRKYLSDRVVAEVNNGGDMVAHVIQSMAKKNENIPIIKVRASRGKLIRAEPVGALYEQARVHHLGYFQSLEDQMTGWQPGEKSPDRMDALVWVLTWLMVGRGSYSIVGPGSLTKQSSWRGNR